ncbi:hypothetical protein ACQPZ2_28425 [Nocardia pseudovaccinii]|uniref:hypothetical protein n=1 Tax=Nocardia pseudovaccinii TaxID=189540 RepID=UPI003D8C50F7
MGTSRRSFAKSITVPPDAEFGSFSIIATCDRSEQLTRTVTIQIARPPTGTTTTTTTSSAGEPDSGVGAQPSDSQFALPPPAPPTGSHPTDRLDDALALGALMLAIAVATFVLNRLRKRAHHPAEPQLRVRVVEGAAPTIHVHRIGATPTVRVRLFGENPLLQIREIPQ